MDRFLSRKSGQPLDIADAMRAAAGNYQSDFLNFPSNGTQDRDQQAFQQKSNQSAASTDFGARLGVAPAKEPPNSFGGHTLSQSNLGARAQVENQPVNDSPRSLSARINRPGGEHNGRYAPDNKPQPRSGRPPPSQYNIQQRSQGELSENFPEKLPLANAANNSFSERLRKNNTSHNELSRTPDNNRIGNSLNGNEMPNSSSMPKAPVSFSFRNTAAAIPPSNGKPHFLINTRQAAVNNKNNEEPAESAQYTQVHQNLPSTRFNNGEINSPISTRQTNAKDNGNKRSAESPKFPQTNQNLPATRSSNRETNFPISMTQTTLRDTRSEKSCQSTKFSQAHQNLSATRPPWTNNGETNSSINTRQTIVKGTGGGEPATYRANQQACPLPNNMPSTAPVLLHRPSQPANTLSIQSLPREANVPKDLNGRPSKSSFKDPTETTIERSASATQQSFTPVSKAMTTTSVPPVHLNRRTSLAKDPAQKMNLSGVVAAPNTNVSISAQPNRSQERPSNARSNGMVQPSSVRTADNDTPRAFPKKTVLPGAPVSPNGRNGPNRMTSTPRNYQPNARTTDARSLTSSTFGVPQKHIIQLSPPLKGQQPSLGPVSASNAERPRETAPRSGAPQVSRPGISQDSTSRPPRRSYSSYDFKAPDRLVGAAQVNQQSRFNSEPAGDIRNRLSQSANNLQQSSSTGSRAPANQNTRPPSPLETRKAPNLSLGTTNSTFNENSQGVKFSMRRGANAAPEISQPPIVTKKVENIQELRQKRLSTNGPQESLPQRAVVVNTSSLPPASRNIAAPTENSHQDYKLNANNSKPEPITSQLKEVPANFSVVNKNSAPVQPKLKSSAESNHDQKQFENIFNYASYAKQLSMSINEAVKSMDLITDDIALAREENVKLILQREDLKYSVTKSMSTREIDAKALEAASRIRALQEDLKSKLEDFKSIWTVRSSITTASSNRANLEMGLLRAQHNSLQENIEKKLRLRAQLKNSITGMKEFARRKP
ncbi:hypothetical protein V1514DRAFT_150685 [Lipomyces japonicus]|uniref:uncharacterized protein n=1 Tax=Lipomyces japonicus TaxID=56871 RepID=UPI0034CDABD1